MHCPFCLPVLCCAGHPRGECGALLQGGQGDPLRRPVNSWPPLTWRSPIWRHQQRNAPRTAACQRRSSTRQQAAAARGSPRSLHTSRAVKRPLETSLQSSVRSDSTLTAPSALRCRRGLLATNTLRLPPSPPESPFVSFLLFHIVCSIHSSPALLTVTRNKPTSQVCSLLPLPTNCTGAGPSRGEGPRLPTLCCTLTAALTAAETSACRTHTEHTTGAPCRRRVLASDSSWPGPSGLLEGR